MVPSQEAHAKRLLEACAHLRQIRFNLCPKRMKDEEFWQVGAELMAWLVLIWFV